MLFLYKVITNILYPILILYMYFRKFIKKEHSKRFKEKIYPSHFNVNKTENSKLCWFHAVSIGELNSILPIIEEINTKYTNYYHKISLYLNLLNKQNQKTYINILTHKSLSLSLSLNSITIHLYIY